MTPSSSGDTSSDGTASPRAAPPTGQPLFKLLGPLEIVHGGESVVLPSSQPTTLLATLLLHANTTVSQAYLSKAVWADGPPVSGGMASIHTAMLRLRRLLAKYGLGGEEGAGITTQPSGYRMAASPSTLDLLAFRDAIRRSGDCGSPEKELDVLQRALAMWRGDPFANVRSPLLRASLGAALDEERANVITRCHEIQLARDDCGSILPGLRELVAQRPGDERVAAHLMEALYRTGRQTEALAEFQRIGAHLREQFGVDPGESLRRLQIAILNGEDARAFRSRQKTEQPPSPDGRTAAVSAVRSLPDHMTPSLIDGAEPADFTGRSGETEYLTQRLLEGDARHLVAVSGFPGVGKTSLVLRLARKLSHRFPGGVRYFNGRNGAVPRSSAPHQRALIVIDGVRDTNQLAPLLTWASDHSVLVTSRLPLPDLALSWGATVFRLGVWARSESLGFLKAVLGPGRIGAESEASEELAALCHDHPLSLRILATQLLLRPEQQLAQTSARLRTASREELAMDCPYQKHMADEFDAYLAQLPAPGVGLLRTLAALPIDSFTQAHISHAEPSVGTRSEQRIRPQALLGHLLDAGTVEQSRDDRYVIPPVLRHHLLAAPHRPDGSSACSTLRKG